MAGTSKRSFDRIWALIDSNTLRRIARSFGGRSTLRKEECVAWMNVAMKDPQRIKTRIEALPSYERSLLAFIKFFGGEIERNQLKLAMYIAGAKFPGNKLDYLDPFEEVMEHFLKSGLAFNHSTFGTYTTLSRYSGGLDIIFSDERILEFSDDPTFQPIESLPVNPPPAPLVRSPRLITMQMIGVLHAIEGLHGLKLTKSKEVRATELRKLAKTLDWKDDSLVEGELVLPNASSFSIQILRAAGMLEVQKDLLVLSPRAYDFTGWRVEEQVRVLLQAVFHIQHWYETERLYLGYYPQNLKAARFAAATLLRCLPPDQKTFYTVDDFDQALFERIGEHFKLLSISPRFHDYDRDPRAAELKYGRWLVKQRNEWLKTERVWLENAMTTWMFFLGLVALELNGDVPVRIGLSELGQSVLYPELEAQQPEQPANSPPNQPPWIIQPNFDVVAYLDHLSNAQLTFLERNADRLRTNEHIAEYHISRESTYRGLESGLTIEEILAGWQAGSGRDLPQNVSVEAREWASAYDQMALYRQVDLAEYPNESAREAAMRNGVEGKPVGDRFLLITKPLSKAQVKAFYGTVDYSRPPMRCLIIEEDGTIRVTEQADLLLDAQLQEWTELAPDGQRRLTRASVQRSIEAGRSVSSLYKLLEERISRIMPPIIQIAIRAWAGYEMQVSMGNMLLLHSASPDISYAIQNSAILKPYLRGIMAPGYFLVDPEQVEDLLAHLAEFGLDVRSLTSFQRH